MSLPVILAQPGSSSGHIGTQPSVLASLFHAMLTPFFNDIPREDYAPSLAGSPSRIDFLLKREQIAIEIKKTRRH